jgi:hypothetical protein
MIHDDQAADAVVNALASLTRLLYRLASEPPVEPTRSAARRTARAIADQVDRDLARVADAEAREALAILAGIADSVADGVIAGSEAGAVIALLLEQLSHLVDLDELAAASTSEQRDVLDSTAGLIGELMIGAGDDPMEGAMGGVSVLTVLLSNEGRNAWVDVHEELRAAGVPHSVVDPMDSDTGLETLWLPGMRTPLRRTIVRRGGAQSPVLTWRDHRVLAQISGEGLSYTTLADAYLRADVRDAVSGTDGALLGRIAEAIAADDEQPD